MKKKVLLSSIATIALCLCLIAGSTFALFTSRDEVNIAVTAGKVDMVAGIAITSVESVQADSTTGTIADENGALYSYTYSDVDAPYNFINGGSAEVNGAVLTIDKITPGDRINLTVSGTNNSNVAIQYRYVIECLSGDDLMKGLELTINNVAIDKYMESYTSPWAPLAVGMSMANVPITIELPVSAGNEFQLESTEIRVLVEAVQGNAVVDDNTDPIITYYNTAFTSAELADVLADPFLPEIEVDITEDFNAVLNVNKKVEMALNGNAVNDNIVNSGTLTLSGGDINAISGSMNSCGFQNNGGTATLTDIVMNAGSAADYSNISHGGTVVYNNVKVNAAGGGIGATGGANITINGGSVDISSTSTSGRYNIYAVGDGTVVTVNGGEYSFSKTLNQKRAYIYADAGATVYVTGGTFGAASARDGYTAGILGSGTVIITGGTFGFDPSAWVANGYVATESNGVWTVSAQ